MSCFDNQRIAAVIKDIHDRCGREGYNGRDAKEGEGTCGNPRSETRAVP